MSPWLLCYGSLQVAVWRRDAFSLESAAKDKKSPPKVRLATRYSNQVVYHLGAHVDPIWKGLLVSLVSFSLLSFIHEVLSSGMLELYRNMVIWISRILEI